MYYARRLPMHKSSLSERRANFAFSLENRLQQSPQSKKRLQSQCVGNSTSPKLNKVANSQLCSGDLDRLTPSPKLVILGSNDENRFLVNFLQSISADIDSLNEEMDYIIATEETFRNSLDSQNEETARDGLVEELNTPITIPSQVDTHSDTDMKYFAEHQDEVDTMDNKDKFMHILKGLSEFRTQLLACSQLSFKFLSRANDLCTLESFSSMEDTPSENENDIPTTPTLVDESCLSLVDLDLHTAMINRDTNRGLYHNLPHPYTPDWAKEVIKKVYNPASIVSQKSMIQLVQKQDGDETESKMDEDWVIVVKNNVLRSVDLKLRQRRLKFLVSQKKLNTEAGVSHTAKGSKLHKVSFSSRLDICIFPSAFVMTHHERESAMYDGFLDGNMEVFDLYQDEEICHWWPTPCPVKEQTAKVKADNKPTQLVSILKPVSAPKPSDGEHYFTPIEVNPSPNDKRYMKNIPRVIEFAAYAETKLGLKTDYPTGYQFA